MAGQTSAMLGLSLHALRWDGSQSYLSEACDAAGSCAAAAGGQDALGRARLLGAIGYFKAPNAEIGDNFGSVALSADGGTLALGAPLEDSADASNAADNNAFAAAAAYVYRRSSTGQWGVDAYIKAPNAGGDDRSARASRCPPTAPRWRLALGPSPAPPPVPSTRATAATPPRWPTTMPSPPPTSTDAHPRANGVSRPTSRRPTQVAAISSAPSSRCPPTATRWRWARCSRKAPSPASSTRATAATPPRWLTTAPPTPAPPTSTAAPPRASGASRPTSRRPTQATTTDSARPSRCPPTAARWRLALGPSPAPPPAPSTRAMAATTPR